MVGTKGTPKDPYINKDSGKSPVGNEMKGASTATNKKVRDMFCRAYHWVEQTLVWPTDVDRDHLLALIVSASEVESRDHLRTPDPKLKLITG